MYIVHVQYRVVPRNHLKHHPSKVSCCYMYFLSGITPKPSNFPSIAFHTANE